MLFRSKPRTVSAFQFDGTFTGPGGVQAADDFVRANFVENCEVTCQGKVEPLALDVITSYGLRTIERGGWLYCEANGLFAEDDETFRNAFEEAT